uniref:Synaptopodin 2-like protein n=1 Tax=Gasterosteus aculeatus TaxID=69293 RepID=G3NEL6_GASAC
MVAEEIVVSLSGGSPWGFRLQGGAEQQKPLQVRRRSKACRAGLKEDDELVAIGNHMCAELSHAQAMSLIDMESHTLNLRVKRSEHSGSPASPRSSVRTLSPPAAPLLSHRSSILSPTGVPRGITSPPDSEAYYGETDSDADTQSLTHRRQRRTPPHARSPARYDKQEEEETSEASPAENSSTSPSRTSGQLQHTPQRLGAASGSPAHRLCPPSGPTSGKQLVPMVGPQRGPVSDELSNTYVDKARQAKLQRGESVVEKQVKEARTKCRSIASLLTDAPNPNSKGVLMFKKRRQRAKKYTLTCFGVLSGSEVDEEGFSASFDPTWDTGYLDLLDRTPGLWTSVNQSPGLEVSGLESSAYQGLRLESSIRKQPTGSQPAQMSPPAVALTNGSLAVSRASVVLNPPSQMPPPSQHGKHPNPGPIPFTDSDHPLNPNVLNRTARPFTAGSSSRASVTSVMFRPPQPKQPATNPSTFSPQPALYASPSVPFSPVSPQGTSFCPSPAQGFSPSSPQAFSSPPAPYLTPSTYFSASPITPPHPPNLAQVSFHAHPTPPPPTQPFPSPSVHTYSNVTGDVTPGPPAATATAPPPQASLATREERISVPAGRTGILHDARRRSGKKPMFCSVQNKDVSPNPDLLSMVQNMDVHFGSGGHESGPEEDWLRLGAEACNFMQAQRKTRPPPVAPKPQTPQVPQMEGKGGELFARRQNRMDRYTVERSPSVAAVPYSPARPRESSPTPSLPSTWKYSSSIRAPPPISYNPLLSPSCPLKVQKKPVVAKSGPAGSKGQKKGLKSVDIMSHQPYQLNSSLFSYGGGVPMDTSTYQQQKGMTSGPQKTTRVYEVKRFSTPPPTSTGPALKVIVPRSATTLGEPLRRSDLQSPPLPPCDTAPASRQFKSAPDLSPSGPPSSSLPNRVPRPRFSTSNLGLQPCVWRPGSTAH